MPPSSRFCGVLMGTSSLRSYASLECVAFPQITQFAACCTLGMRRIPRTCTFGVVAADMERAAFQHLQGYITTLLKSLSSIDKVLLYRQSNENITTSAFSFEEHQQAVSSSSACPTLSCKLECVACRPSLPDVHRWQPRHVSRVHPNLENPSRFLWSGTRHVAANYPHNCSGVARNASHLADKVYFGMICSGRLMPNDSNSL
jgi:hypothetical protein